MSSDLTALSKRLRDEADARELPENAGWFAQCVTDDMRAAADALDAAEQRASSDVKVKGLEWDEPSRASNMCWVARCVFGTYSAVNDDGWYAVLEDGPWGKGFEWIGDDRAADTLATAMAACQADYRSRILSALQNGGGDA